MASTRGHKVVNLLDYRARKVLSQIHKYGINTVDCSQIVWYNDKLDVLIKKDNEWLEVTQLLKRGVK